MQGNAPSPDGPEENGAVTQSVADAVKDNWVDRYAPHWSRPYLRLSRADRPIGTWLLLIPCWWGLVLAILWDQSPRWEDLWIFASCAAGAFLMRGAGCTWNDITDRHIDDKVERTRSRPIPSGQVSVKGALLWMGIQALLGLAILLTYNTAAIALGVLSLLPVAIYPFAKRFTWWPQVFLGVAFNWGALLAWTAHAGALHWPAVMLYLAGISWTLFYDTIYAHQDTEDDALIGVKSTARLFGSDTPMWMRRFIVATVMLMAFGIIMALLPGGNVLALVIALAAPWAMGWHMTYQLRAFDMENNDTLLKIFRLNRDTGLIPLIFLGVALLV
ncbi:MAG: 4-hydroxybenzoate octaprenyltransferase [Paracoccaceae bacterium]